MSLVEDYLPSFWELELEEELHCPYAGKSASDLVLEDPKTDEWDLEADVPRHPGGPYHSR